jgi:hypothetical protein
VVVWSLTHERNTLDHATRLRNALSSTGQIDLLDLLEDALHDSYKWGYDDGEADGKYDGNKS